MGKRHLRWPASATIGYTLHSAHQDARTSILTCDASSLAGLPPGHYSEWGQDFEMLSSGRITVFGTSYLAGSSAFTDLCVGHAIQYGGVSLADAIDMAEAQAARTIGVGTTVARHGSACGPGAIRLVTGATVSCSYNTCRRHTLMEAR